MVIVLDTNVIISALLSPAGPSANIINHWEANEFEVVVSRQLIIELEKVIKYPKITKYFKISPELIAAFIRSYMKVATIVEPMDNLDVITEDPADNIVLECAVSGNANFIVTGDKHLLNIKAYHGIVILPPAGFVRLLEMKTK